MKKFCLKINGEKIGDIGSFTINETKAAGGHYSIVKGSANRIRLSKVDLFKSLTSDLWQNRPIELEFETDDSIWKAHRSWISSLNYYEEPEEALVMMGDLEFSCELLNILQKNVEPTLAPAITEPDISMINKFAAAISSYYKAKK